MSDKTDLSDRGDTGGTIDPQDAADEAFLFAVARNPARYEALTDIEIKAITAWTLGTASTAETDRACSAIRQNLAAKELLLSLRLEQAAAAGPPVPRRVSRAIQRQIAPAPGRRLGLPSVGTWRFAGVAALAMAAILMMVVMRHPNEPTGARFQVASLSDRSILDEPGGTVMRGASAQTPTPGPARPALDFADFDVPVALLRQVFAEGAQPVDPQAAAALARGIPLLAHVSADNLPELTFDRQIEAVVKTGITVSMLTLRAYDLTIPANAALRGHLQVPEGTRMFFITLAP